MIAADPVKAGFFVEAPFLRAVAAVGETAGLGRIDGRRNFPFQQYALPLPIDIGDGDGGQQRLRVGVQRIGEKLLRRGLFDQFAQVHHVETVVLMSRVDK